MSEPTVDLKITTTGDATGANQVEAAVQAIGSEAVTTAQEAAKAAVQVKEVARAVEAVAVAQNKVQASNPWVTQGRSIEGLTRQHASLMAQFRRTPEGTAEFTRLTKEIQQTGSELDRMESHLRRLPVAQDRAAGSSRNLGNALLQSSRGLQDMQYGLAGAVNNLEGIASALGLGAGVAGVVTVLAVAVQTLGPHVVEWLKSLDTEGAKLDELINTLHRAATAIKGDFTGNTENAARISEAFTKQLEAERKALEANAAAVEHDAAMIKKRADLQKTDNQKKLESDIEDIKAQKLPPEQEKAAIASRKHAELNANQQLDDVTAEDGLNKQADKIGALEKRRDELNAKKAALEKEKEAALEYERLLEDRAKLEKKVKEAEAATYDPNIVTDVPSYNEAKAKVDKAKAELEKSKARTSEIKNAAPDGRVRGAGEIDKELNEVKPDAEAATAQAKKDRAAFTRDRDAAMLDKEYRDKAYQREHEKVSREQHGGVIDNNNQALPDAPFQPAPLPVPAGPGAKLPPKPEGFGPDELNPSRAPTQGPAPAFGPQPTQADAARPQRDLVAEERNGTGPKQDAPASSDLNKVAASTDKGSQAIVQFAQTAVTKMDAMTRQLQALEQQVRNMRAAA